MKIYLHWGYITNRISAAKDSSLPDDKTPSLSQIEKTALKLKSKYFPGLQPYSIQRTDKGRPFFRDAQNLFFNGSHTGDFCLTALAEQNIAVDLERCRKRDFNLVARHGFSTEEQDYLAQSPQIEKDFFLLWTLKEAAIKLQGESIFALKKTIKIDLTSQTPFTIAEQTRQTYPHSLWSYLLCDTRDSEKKQLIMSLAIEGQCDHLEIEWSGHHKPTIVEELFCWRGCD